MEKNMASTGRDGHASLSVGVAPKFMVLSACSRQVFHNRVELRRMGVFLSTGVYRATVYAPTKLGMRLRENLVQEVEIREGIRRLRSRTICIAVSRGRTGDRETPEMRQSARYGVRVQRHKRSCRYDVGLGRVGAQPNDSTSEREVFNCEKGLSELVDFAGDPAHAHVVKDVLDGLGAILADISDFPEYDRLAVLVQFKRAV